MGNTHFPDGMDTPSKLIKRMDALKEESKMVSDCHSARYPDISGVPPQEADKIAQALNSAVTAAFPAVVNAFVRCFTEVDIFILDATTVEVWAGDDYVRIPRAQLTDYWVGEGHRIV